MSPTSFAAHHGQCLASCSRPANFFSPSDPSGFAHYSGKKGVRRRLSDVFVKGSGQRLPQRTIHLEQGLMK